MTGDSVANGETNVAVRVGNTLQKEMEKEYTNPDAVKALPPSEPPAKKPVPVYELTRVPAFKVQIKPDYPAEARRNEIEGVVELEVLISETGKVLKVRVLKSLGYGLDEAAVAAVKKSEFLPGLKGKEAVPVKLRIPYRFVLEE
ncbi:MAG: energy transducer TonB [Myxococcales bacterium]|nr:MAG: energy transducer TonB [Myxococcales bacterium]